MQERMIVRKDLSETELLQYLAKVSGCDFSGRSQDVDVIVGALSSILKNDGGEITTEYRHPNFPPGTIGMMVLQKRYWLSAKAASLSASCAIIDALLTSGLLALLIGPQALREALTKLNDRTGEVCVLQSVNDWGGELNANEAIDAVFAHLSSKDCINRPFRCAHREQTTCCIEREPIRACVASLKDKGIFSISEDLELRVTW